MSRKVFLASSVFKFLSFFGFFSQLVIIQSIFNEHIFSYNTLYGAFTTSKQPLFYINLLIYCYIKSLHGYYKVAKSYEFYIRR